MHDDVKFTIFCEELMTHVGWDTCPVRGGGKAGRPLPEENVEKQNTPWLVVPHCISDNEQVTNQNELNYKTEALSSD